LRSKFVISSLILAFVAVPAFASESPVDCDHLMAWLTGGASNAGIIKILHSRGSSLVLNSTTEVILRKAGSSSQLLSAIQKAANPSAQHSSCSAALVKAAELSHRKQYEDAEDTSSSSRAIGTQLSTNTVPPNSLKHGSPRFTIAWRSSSIKETTARTRSARRAPP
jgi:hypothetical protein